MKCLLFQQNIQQPKTILASATCRIWIYREEYSKKEHLIMEMDSWSMKQNNNFIQLFQDKTIIAEKKNG